MECKDLCLVYFGSILKICTAKRETSDNKLQLKTSLNQNSESGNSSVGRASDCRVCSNRAVPGSNPGYRIFYFYFFLLKN